jgi:DNA polymerase III subunit delta'
VLSLDNRRDEFAEYWHPESSINVFSKLIGNIGVKLTLRRLIANGRVPNSLLLTGDEGVGKRQFALELVKNFICPEPVNGEACDVCAICRRAVKFEFPKTDDKDDHKRVIFSDHPDVGMVIPYNRNILVDSIRHLETEANFRPYEAAARFFVIDNADKMNDNASNALLKTLEEPPETSYIFLITSRPDSLLPTIRSRCQTIRFAPVETDEIERFLIEQNGFTHDEARLAARLGRGSVGRAASINVEEFKKRREKMYGAVRNALEKGSLAAILRTAEEMNDTKDKTVFEQSLDVLQSLIHDVWTMTVSGDQGRVVNSDLVEELALLSANAGTADLPRWMGSIDELRANLQVNINRKVAADALLVSMAD